MCVHRPLLPGWDRELYEWRPSRVCVHRPLLTADVLPSFASSSCCLNSLATTDGTTLPAVSQLT